jgi:hypothetical protein
VCERTRDRSVARTLSVTDRLRSSPSPSHASLLVQRARQGFLCMSEQTQFHCSFLLNAVKNDWAIVARATRTKDNFQARTLNDM